MFILGLLIGPALAVVIADYLFASSSVDSRVALAALGVVLLVLVVVPFFAVELRVGLLLGFPAGLLLAASPVPRGPAAPAEGRTPSP